MIKRKYLSYKLVPITQIIIGAILLFREVQLFLRLPKIGELIYDTVNHKEGTYSWIFLYAVLFISGLSYFINKKAHWVLNVGFLIILCGMFFDFFVLALQQDELGATLFFLIVFLFFCGIVFLILIRKETTKLWSITTKTKILAIILGIGFAMVFWGLVIIRYWI